MFRLKNLRNNDKGISPVVGVIIMVAVTVVLSSVIGVVVLDIGQNSTQNGGNVQGYAEFDQSPEGVTVTYTNEVGSDGIEVLVDGQEVPGAVVTKTGNSVTVTAGEGEEVTVVGFKGTPDDRTAEDTLVTEEARSDTTGGSDPTVASGGQIETVTGSVSVNPDIDGASVEVLDDSDSVVATTTTDMNGDFSVDVLKPSNKSVNVDVNGFSDPALTHPLYADVTQSIGDSTTVNFTFDQLFDDTKDGSTILRSNSVSEVSNESTAVSIDSTTNLTVSVDTNEFGLTTLMSDNDGDSDLVQVEYDIYEGRPSTGTLVYDKTVSLDRVAQYDPPSETVTPDNGYTIQTDKDYYMVVTGMDEDGNEASDQSDVLSGQTGTNDGGGGPLDGGGGTGGDGG